MDAFEYVKGLCASVKKAQRELACARTAEKDAALESIAAALEESSAYILAENKKDLENAEKNGVPKTMLDRLALTDARINGISSAIREVIALKDPVGNGTVTERPNGLRIMKVGVPLGVVGIIYEARPNVTADAAALCLKSGNGAVLRGGKEALNTNRAIVSVIKKALLKSKISPDVIELIDDPSRESTNALMNMKGLIDVLIPRGGKGLIRAVTDNASVPVIETGAGNCHIYIDESADLEKSLNVAVNAKVSRPSVCNAVETMLVHSDVAGEFLPAFAKATEQYSLEIRGCQRTCEILTNAQKATETDYETEYNDYIIAVKVVDTLDEAIEHISRYSTGHSEAIMTEDIKNARYFCSHIDAAAVYVNASTRFTDGGEFGFGAEIGISTQKLHARGPMGLPELTTVKYIIEGDGQVR